MANPLTPKCDSDQFDFFVSYSRKDNATGWITQFVEELLAEHRKFSGGRAFVPFFDKEDIQTGDDWQHRIAHGLATSRQFLAFISPNYFASEWCRKEWRTWIDLEIAKHILSDGVAPIYIVEVPGLDNAAFSEQDVVRRIAELCRLPAPHDHNRDYTDAPRYPAVAGVMDLARRCDDRLRFAIDLRCPWVRGENNEHIHIVGSENPGNATRQLAFAAKLEAARPGPLPYRAAGTLPFGRAWNTTKGMPVSFGRWMVAHAPGTPTVATFEIPYANAEGVVMTADGARMFGRDLAAATG